MSPRTQRKVQELVQGNAAWCRCRSKETGKIIAYGVPSESTPGKYHLCNPVTGCDCRSYQERGWCSHHAAVREYVQMRRAEAASTAPFTADPAEYERWLASVPDADLLFDPDLDDCPDDDPAPVTAATCTVAAVTATINEELFPGVEPAPQPVPAVTGPRRFFPTWNDEVA